MKRSTFKLYPRGFSSKSSLSRWKLNLEMLVFVKGGEPKNLEKNLRKIKRTNNDWNSTHVWIKSRIWTQASLVEVECSHHHNIPASRFQSWSQSLRCPCPTGKAGSGNEISPFAVISVSCVVMSICYLTGWLCGEQRIYNSSRVQVRWRQSVLPR